MSETYEPSCCPMCEAGPGRRTANMVCDNCGQNYMAVITEPPEHAACRQRAQSELGYAETKLLTHIRTRRLDGHWVAP